MAGKDKKSKESKKVQKGREEVRAANKPEYVTGTGQKLWRVHLKQDCQHRICDIHNPPQGIPESDWPTHWRADRGLMERICPHGIGHPTKAHMEFLKEMDAVRGTENAKWEGIHGCDGCCAGNYDLYNEACEDAETDSDYELPEEYRPYFDDSPFLPSNGASDWERGISWDGLLASLFDRKPTPVKKGDGDDLLGYFFSKEELASNAHMCPPDHCPEPEWIDHDAPPNGIGPICRDCGNLIDWHPVDHALGCLWL